MSNSFERGPQKAIEKTFKLTQSDSNFLRYMAEDEIARLQEVLSEMEKTGTEKFKGETQEVIKGKIEATKEIRDKIDFFKQ